MEIIPTIFRPVDPEQFHQLARMLRKTTQSSHDTLKKISKLRKKAACLLMRRAQRLDQRLRTEASQQLEQDRARQERRLRVANQVQLRKLHDQAREVTISVLKEAIGDDSERTAQSILRRLSLLFTQLGKQHQLTISLECRASADLAIQRLCLKHGANLVVSDEFSPGDFMIGLPFGSIESTLADDLENLVDHFSGSTVPQAEPCGNCSGI